MSTQPCRSVARAILGAVDAPDGVLLKCGRENGHEPPHRFLMEWADPPPMSERSGLVTDEIAAYLANYREDPGFRTRLAERIERDREILRRLAEGEGPADV